MPPQTHKKLGLGLAAAIIFGVPVYAAHVDRAGRFRWNLPFNQCALVAGKDMSGNAVSAAPPIVVTADQLGTAFQVNPTQADETYTGRTLIVSGTVSEIDNDLGVPVVKLNNASSYFVECAFDTKSMIAQLRQGQEVRIKGTGSGVTLDIVTLAHCRLAK